MRQRRLVSKSDERRELPLLRALTYLLLVIPLLIVEVMTVTEGQELLMDDSEIYTVTISPKSISASNPNAISSGHVIAYGNYISPPYLIDVDKDGKVYINGVQYSPRLVRNDSKVVSKTLEVDEETIAQHQLDVLIHSKHNTLKKEYGESELQNLLLQFVIEQPIITEAFFDNFGNLKVTYTDGNTEIMSFDDEEDENEKVESMATVASDLKSIITSELQSGAVLIFGFRVTLTLPSVYAGVVTQIEEIQKEVLPKKEKVEKLKALVIDEELANEIYYNYTPLN
jgi:hypothetical protein